MVSGGVKGGDDLVGKPALLDIEVGKGRVIAFGFDPIHRYQTESDFRLVWNAILNWNDLPPSTTAGPLTSLPKRGVVHVNVHVTDSSLDYCFAAYSACSFSIRGSRPEVSPA